MAPAGFRLFVVCICFLHLTFCERQDECQAGNYFDSIESKCELCGDNTYSNDNADQCLDCNLDPDKHNCICDTTGPLHMRGQGSLHENVKKYCYEKGDENMNLTCNVDCWFWLEFTLLGGRTVGRQISDQVDIKDCNCDFNRNTRESCLRRKDFNEECLLEKGCDDAMFPLQADMNARLDECIDAYRTTKKCDKERCVDFFSSNASYLSSCHCYHQYEYNITPNDEFVLQNTTQSINCLELKQFYRELELGTCIDDISVLVWTVLTILIIFTFILLVGGSYFVRYQTIVHGRKLKRNGTLGGIIKHVDWKNIRVLGAAEAGGNIDQMHTREIVLKVKFSVFPWSGGRFGFKPQHVVLKVFSENQTVQQQIELKITESIADKNRAKECNIITVYGPSQRAGNKDLVEFLQELRKKSPISDALKQIIRMNYLGNDCPDPACKYIMMNHCNELSFSKYRRNNQVPMIMKKQLFRDLALALHFLHVENAQGGKPMIIHCDVKPDNVFVKRRKKRTKFILGDFGLAEHHLPGAEFKVKGGTPGYMPPEWCLTRYEPLREAEVYSDLQRDMLRVRALKTHPCSIDIYAFGVFVWSEIHNNHSPWSQLRQEHGSINADRRTFFGDFFSIPDYFTKRPVSSRNQNDESEDFNDLLRLAEDCWQSDLTKRPSASDILTRRVLSDQLDTGNPGRNPDQSNRTADQPAHAVRYIVDDSYAANTHNHQQTSSMRLSPEVSA